jgi:hypothetical protein
MSKVEKINDLPQTQFNEIVGLNCRYFSNKELRHSEGDFELLYPSVNEMKYVCVCFFSLLRKIKDYVLCNNSSNALIFLSSWVLLFSL